MALSLKPREGRHNSQLYTSLCLFTGGKGTCKTHGITVVLIQFNEQASEYQIIIQSPNQVTGKKQDVRGND